MMSPRAVQSRIASATSGTGLTVGWSASKLPSSVTRPAKLLTPAYSQTFERDAAMATKFDIVSVGAVAILKHQDVFMRLR